MGDKSKIEWTQATWTPVRARRHDTGKVGVHCERVSEGCKNCYACSHNKRNLPVHGTGLDFTILNREKVEIFVDDDMLMAPLRWKRPRKIFVCSQTDLFGEFVSDEQIDQVFAAMALCPQHTFQVLTKRPERMRAWFQSARGHHAVEVIDVGTGRVRSASWLDPLPNVWIGVTAENQARADERIPLLLQTPAEKRFISVEPMLGPVFIDRYLRPHWTPQDGADHGPWLDWVICGGESGRGARPVHPDWARGLRDQCVDAKVPFLWKQWGSWQNGSDEEWQGKIVLNDGRRCSVPEELDQDTRNNWPKFRPTKMAFVGKKAAGRLLDGREWNEFPEVKNA